MASTMRAVLAGLALCLFTSSLRAEIASCYGREHGQTRTATGERYDPAGLTAAHRTLPFGTLVLVCRAGADAGKRPFTVAGDRSQPIGARADSRCVTVRINDRGPAAWTHRAIDLSLGACRAIGSSGLARVSLKIIGGIHAAAPFHRGRLHRRLRFRARRRRANGG